MAGCLRYLEEGRRKIASKRKKETAFGVVNFLHAVGLRSGSPAGSLF